MKQLYPLVESGPKKTLILSPSVGSYSLCPENGSIIYGNAFIGRMILLSRSYALYLPAGMAGRVEYNKDRDKQICVEYGQELFTLITETGDKNIFNQERPGEALDTDKENGETEHGFYITAFSPGIFYRKPAPQAPPYVQVGQRVEKGKILGLIEVMKMFNYITFPGTATSGPGIVEKIYVEDAREIKLGQKLFLIKGDK